MHLLRMVSVIGVLLATYLAVRPATKTGPAHAAIVLWGAGFLGAFGSHTGEPLRAFSTVWLTLGWVASLAYCAIVLAAGRTLRELFRGLLGFLHGARGGSARRSRMD